MATPVCTVDATGIHAPDFSTILAYLQGQYRSIYGSDVVLTPDTQDGQWVAIIAAAVNDTNAMAVAVYNAFSPSTAQGTGLSSIVKTNGIARLVPTYSTVDLVIIGQTGTIIANGVAQDTNSNRWNLPSSVVIPLSGTITVTATSAILGAIKAPAGTITTIGTPTLGWQSVTNPSQATAGSPVETDAALRARQAISAGLPSLNLLGGLNGAIAAIPGVTRFRTYENDKDYVDLNGIPGHSLAFVVDGGDATTIASTIAAKKGPGIVTYGYTCLPVTDSAGIPHAVCFSRPNPIAITYAISVHALAGYTTNDEAALKKTLSDWTNALGIGVNVSADNAFVAAKQDGNASSLRYKVLAFGVARDGLVPVNADVQLAFNEAPACDPSNISLTYL